LAGVASYLKEQNSDVRIVLADPPGSVLYNFVKTGKLERCGEGSITEGVPRTPQTPLPFPPDQAVHIPARTRCRIAVPFCGPMTFEFLNGHLLIPVRWRHRYWPRPGHGQFGGCTDRRFCVHSGRSLRQHGTTPSCACAPTLLTDRATVHLSPMTICCRCLFICHFPCRWLPLARC